MIQGKPGADSSFSPVTEQLVEEAKKFFGETPVLWGRYFTRKDKAEYNHAVENQPLALNNIRLLPIASRTNHVDGSTQQGVTDAQACVDDILETFTADYLASNGGEFLVFLDVELHPSLSLEYYTGWAQTLLDYSRKQTANKVSLLPCVYAAQTNNPTWITLTQASKAGVSCHGVWVARYYFSTCLGPEPKPIPEWDPSFLTPRVELPCKILLWQYAQNCLGGKIDSSQINPGIELDGDLLSKLILPPKAA